MRFLLTTVHIPSVLGRQKRFGLMIKLRAWGGGGLIVMRGMFALICLINMFSFWLADLQFGSWVTPMCSGLLRGLIASLEEGSRFSSSGCELVGNPGPSLAASLVGDY